MTVHNFMWMLQETAFFQHVKSGPSKEPVHELDSMTILWLDSIHRPNLPGQVFSRVFYMTLAGNPVKITVHYSCTVLCECCKKDSINCSGLKWEIAVAALLILHFVCRRQQKAKYEHVICALALDSVPDSFVSFFSPACLLFMLVNQNLLITFARWGEKMVQL